MNEHGRESAATPRVSGAALIASERARQLAEEGWSADHDDGHEAGQIAAAAACYAIPQQFRRMETWRNAPALWPWDSSDWKPSPDDRVRELVKAGALIAAEIDRLTRASSSGASSDARGLA